MTEAEARRRIATQQRRLADECLADAEAAAARDSARLVWNRAYYACFHAATAVFVARNRRFRKHRGIITAAHEELVPAGFLAAEQAVAFDGLFAQRLDADYGDFLDIPREQVVNTLETARRFVASMRAALAVSMPQMPPNADR
ncbi:MAG: HEPN domain-containing protein [Planctomycetaceae bacterium]